MQQLPCFSLTTQTLYLLSIHHSSKQYFHFKHTRRTNHRTTTVVDAFGVDATTTAVGAEIYDDDVAFVIDVTGGDGDGDGAA